MTNTTTAPMRPGAQRYSEQLHTLIDPRMREYVLGQALIEARQGGYTRPKEGETTRDLLNEAIRARYDADPDGYAAAVLAGRVEMERREAERASPRPAAKPRIARAARKRTPAKA